MKKRPVADPYGAHIELVIDGDQVRLSHVESGYRFAVELRSAARIMAHKARAIADQDGDELRAFVTGAVN